MGTGFSKKKKQAKMLQQQFSQMQDKLEHTEVTGSAGSGLVTVTLSGDFDVKSVVIKPECIDPEDVEGLQDLIKAAFKDAKAKVQEQSQLPNMPGGSPLGKLGMFGM